MCGAGGGYCGDYGGSDDGGYSDDDMSDHELSIWECKYCL